MEKKWSDLVMLAAAAAIVEHRETTESNQKRKQVSFPPPPAAAATAAHEDESDDDDDEDDDLEAVSKQERLIREKALKKPMMNIDGTPPLLVSDQERLEIGGNSARKKRSVNHIIVSSDSFSKQKRLKAEKCLKAPGTTRPPRPKKSKTIIIAKTPPVLPDQFKKIIAKLGGTDIGMVIQKELFETDISRGQARLSMPTSQIEDMNFLTDEEKASLKNKIPMAVELIDTKCSKCEQGMTLRKWDMRKPIYVLTTKWNDVVFSNGLKRDDLVQVWSFRVGSKLHFALVRVGKGEVGHDADEEEVEDGNDVVKIGSSSAADQNTEAETQEQE